MRLVTWNCCRGAFAKKAPLLDAFDAVIAILQECARPVAESRQCLWFGDNVRQGIAVVARAPYRLRRLKPLPDVPKFMVPVRIEGPEKLLLLAVWSKAERPHRYVRGVLRGIAMYRRRIARTPTIVAGDLNSNAIWDSEHPSDRNHSALVDVLRKLGLVSCYHEFHDERHGEETHPTYYFQWKRRRPYHLDYCFAPTAWAKRLSRVEVGSYDPWTKHSDHRPLLVEFTP